MYDPSTLPPLIKIPYKPQLPAMTGVGKRRHDTCDAYRSPRAVSQDENGSQQPNWVRKNATFTHYPTIANKVFTHDKSLGGNPNCGSQKLNDERLGIPLISCTVNQYTASRGKLKCYRPYASHMQHTQLFPHRYTGDDLPEEDENEITVKIKTFDDGSDVSEDEEKKGKNEKAEEEDEDEDDGDLMASASSSASSIPKVLSCSSWSKTDMISRFEHQYRERTYLPRPVRSSGRKLFPQFYGVYDGETIEAHTPSINDRVNKTHDMLKTQAMLPSSWGFSSTTF